MKLYLMALLACTVGVLSAVSLDGAYECADSCSMMELMPQDPMSPWAIEPVVPSDWIDMCSDGELDSCDWTYWSEELALRDNFPSNAECLTDQQFFQAMGQDMQTGYTMASIGGSKFAMTAEMRECDGIIQVVVVPMQPGDSFELDGLLLGHLGSKWRFGEPLVKVYGTIRSRRGKCTKVIQQVTSILIETVEEFSVTSDEADANGYLILQVDGRAE